MGIDRQMPRLEPRQADTQQEVDAGTGREEGVMDFYALCARDTDKSLIELLVMGLCFEDQGRAEETYLTSLDHRLREKFMIRHLRVVDAGDVTPALPKEEPSAA